MLQIVLSHLTVQRHRDHHHLRRISPFTTWKNFPVSDKKPDDFRANFQPLQDLVLMR